MEGDAGTSRLNPTDADDSPPVAPVTEADSEESAEETGHVESADVDEQDEQPLETVAPESRLRRGRVVAVVAALALLAGGLAAGGYLALRAHQDSQATARDNAAAIAAAEDCVAALHAPDIDAMAASQRKIIDCATGDFGAQAAVYASILVEAYQAADAHVTLSQVRAAVERNNADGSVDLLVALTTYVTNVAATDHEIGYRLRVTMARDDGRYKIARVETVSK